MVAERILKELIENSRIRMKDPLGVRAKIEAMIAAGLEKLMVITDFDYTLSCHSLDDGVRCPTTHGVFEKQISGINPDFHNKTLALRDKYIQIEFCPTMSIEEKTPHMLEWWKTSHNLIVENKFNKDLIKSLTKASGVILRPNAPEFLLTVDRSEVPLIVFSAGIGNIIEFVLEDQAKFVPKEMHLISNKMIFDENDICIGFTDPLIHTFNKNSSVISKEGPFFHKLSNRTSILLLGDSLGDCHMDVGVEKENVVLKIGYLNFNVENLLEKYITEYDIVLIDDQTMDIPLMIFNQIHDTFCDKAIIRNNEIAANEIKIESS